MFEKNSEVQFDSSKSKDEKSWFKKWIEALSGPKLGHVLINESSGNVNIYLGSGTHGKVFLWSPERGARWVTKEWARRGHSRIFFPNKEVVKVDFSAMQENGTRLTQEKFEELGERRWTILSDALDREETEAKLAELANDIEDNLGSFRFTIPPEFVLPIVVIFVLLGVVFGLLLV